MIRDGAVLANHRKACLPNYRVFDEKRYFTPGTRAHGGRTERHQGRHPGVRGRLGAGARRARRAAPGPQVLLVINASPYEVNKQRQRERDVGAPAVAETGIPLVFVNLIGGQDELVFDGNSFVMDARGEVTMRAPAFTEGLYVGGSRLGRACGQWSARCRARSRRCRAEEESVYGALVQGTRDYVDKHRFPGVVLGLVGRRRFGA